MVTNQTIVCTVSLQQILLYDNILWVMDKMIWTSLKNIKQEATLTSNSCLLSKNAVLGITKRLDESSSTPVMPHKVSVPVAVWPAGPASTFNVYLF